MKWSRVFLPLSDEFVQGYNEGCLTGGNCDHPLDDSNFQFAQLGFQVLLGNKVLH